MSSAWHCTACDQSYTVVTRPGATEDETKETITGARWCFSGPHATTPLAKGDERRIQRGVVTLTVEPGLQVALRLGTFHQLK